MPRFGSSYCAPLVTITNASQLPSSSQEYTATTSRGLNVHVNSNFSLCTMQTYRRPEHAKLVETVSQLSYPPLCPPRIPLPPTISARGVRDRRGSRLRRLAQGLWPPHVSQGRNVSSAGASVTSLHRSRQAQTLLAAAVGVVARTLPRHHVTISVAQ
jgi:hypothetical protein